MQRQLGSPFLFDSLGNIVGMRNAADQDAPALPVFTWATRPAVADVPSGCAIRISDVGVAPGVLMVSDGTRWVAAGPQMLAKGAPATPTPADTTEDILATITVPAGLLGATGGLRSLAHFSFTNNANNKTIKARLGGIGGTAFFSSVATTQLFLKADVSIWNRAAASQYGGGAQQFTGGGGMVVSTTSTIDTSAATTLVFTGQKAVSGDTLTLEGYTVELLP